MNKLSVICLFIILLQCNAILKSQAPVPDKLTTVVIDAGHGGKDPGAVGKISYEKDIALKIALKLGGYINKYLPDVKVIYTRKTDKFIPLDKRSEKANKAGADLFISIHLNASPVKYVTGTSTYVMGLNKASDNLEVVKRENSVVKYESNYKTKYKGFDPDEPESDIIFSLYQNAYLEQSIIFADKVQKQFKNRAGRKDRGVRQAGLIVLWNCAMPGVLIETGFISNSQEEKYLNSDYGQSIIASAIFRAFRDYKNQKKGNSNGNSSYKPPKKQDVSPSKHTNKTDVVYKVQIASSVRKLEPSPKNFKGLEGVKRKKQGNKYKYTVGNTSDFDEILSLQSRVRKKIPDAYVIAFYKGKQISVKQALEKQK